MSCFGFRVARPLLPSFAERIRSYACLLPRTTTLHVPWPNNYCSYELFQFQPSAEVCRIHPIPEPTFYREQLPWKCHDLVQHYELFQFLSNPLLLRFAERIRFCYWEQRPCKFHDLVPTSSFSFRVAYCSRLPNASDPKPTYYRARNCTVLPFYLYSCTL